MDQTYNIIDWQTLFTWLWRWLPQGSESTFNFEPWFLIGCWNVRRVVQYTWSVVGALTGDGLWWRIAKIHHHLSVCNNFQQSSIVLCTYMNVCGIIILDRAILLHFFRLRLFVLFVGHCNQLWTVTPYWTCTNASHRQQFFPELPTPGRSHNANY